MLSPYLGSTSLTQAPFIPRPHQLAGVQALIQYEGRFSVAEVTVAGGKSGMLGMLAMHYSQFGRVIIVAHNKELVKHNAAAAKLLGINPGICSSSISTNAFARVTVGTIGTIINRVHLFRDVVAILVDEVHMVPPAKSSQYRRLFDKIPHAKVHGLTGTPFRADGTGDLAKTFGPIAYRYTFLDALRDGYVKPLVPVDAGEDETQTIDVEGLKTTVGDFDLDEMAPRAMKLAPSHAKTIIEVMQKFNRRRVLVFCCNIAHVDKMEAEFKRLGVPRVYGVHSQSITGKRDKSVDAFRNDPNGGILVSCNMFTTGFDVQDIDYEAFCRATKSAVYYAQGLGRGARITPYAANCLVSDFGGNIQRHGTLDAVMASPGRALTCDDGMQNGCGSEWETWEHGKTCPKCQLIHKSAPKCKACSERFDPHFAGMRCPHCGQQQADIKQCAACEETYAAFLHPICPFCSFDNTISNAPGKDLQTRGGGYEAVSVKKIIENEPWQAVVSPPVKNAAGGWLLTTKYTTAIWPYEDLPQPHSAFLKRSQNGRYMVAGIYDVNGQVHQR